MRTLTWRLWGSEETWQRIIIKGDLSISSSTICNIAILLATSGHSGVDRLMKNLIPALSAEGVAVDLLHVKNHGPYLDSVPENVRVVDLGAAHTYSSLRPVVRYLRRECPNVLLSDKDKVNRISLMAKTLGRVSSRVAVRTGTTVSKDLEGRGLLHRLAHYLSMHYLYRKADAIIVPSKGAALDLSRFASIPVGRISVVPNPIVTPGLLSEAEEPLAHPWFSNREVPVILGVGELCSRKDFYTLIRAVAKVQQRLPSRLLLIGEGRHRAKLEMLVKELGLQDLVSMPGFIKNPFSYMKKSDLLVQTSRYEGFGNVLVEAMALGTPVVSTDCPSGPREILKNGRFGSLVKVGDVDGVARAIVDTIHDPLPASMLQRAADEYALSSITKAYIKVLGVEKPNSVGETH
ncbi:MAG: glycosyltransferase [Desulfatiglandaceae bacterium]